MKSNEILTTVIKEAYQNDRISDILKEGIEAFQVKINLKQEYLAYYLWKNIHNCYNAMATSPVESINCHIKHKTKASTLNTSLLYEWELIPEYWVNIILSVRLCRLSPYKLLWGLYLDWLFVVLFVNLHRMFCDISLKFLIVCNPMFFPFLGPEGPSIFP